MEDLDNFVTSWFKPLNIKAILANDRVKKRQVAHLTTACNNNASLVNNAWSHLMNASGTSPKDIYHQTIDIVLWSLTAFHPLVPTCESNNLSEWKKRDQKYPYPAETYPRLSELQNALQLSLEASTSSSLKASTSSNLERHDEEAKKDTVIDEGKQGRLTMRIVAEVTLALLWITQRCGIFLAAILHYENTNRRIEQYLQDLSFLVHLQCPFQTNTAIPKDKRSSVVSSEQKSNHHSSREHPMKGDSLQDLHLCNKLLMSYGRFHRDTQRKRNRYRQSYHSISALYETQLEVLEHTINEFTNVSQLLAWKSNYNAKLNRPEDLYLKLQMLTKKNKSTRNKTQLHAYKHKQRHSNFNSRNEDKTITNTELLLRDAMQEISATKSRLLSQMDKIDFILATYIKETQIANLSRSQSSSTTASSCPSSSSETNDSTSSSRCGEEQYDYSCFDLRSIHPGAKIPCREDIHTQDYKQGLRTALHGLLTSSSYHHFADIWKQTESNLSLRSSVSRKDKFPKQSLNLRNLSSQLLELKKEASERIRSGNVSGLFYPIVEKSETQSNIFRNPQYQQEMTASLQAIANELAKDGSVDMDFTNFFGHSIK
eukprot:g114.t1